MARFDRRELAAIFVGGALGAVARVEVGRLFPTGPASWPWAVFAINISGALILAFVVTRLQERLPLSSYRRPLIGTGFCGAYTTFSTLQLQLLSSFQAHAYALALTYAAVSIVCGYLAVFFATALVRRTVTAG